jgi:hypothetical protein
MAKPLIAGVTKDGRNLFHTLRWCNRIPREFRFTLNARQVRGEASRKPDACSDHFDVRELPAEFIPPDNYQTRHPETYQLVSNPAEWAIKAIDAGVDPVACSNKAKAVAA